MKYAIQLTHIKTRKRMLYGNLNGDTIEFVSKEDATSAINEKFPQKALKAKAIALN